MTDLRERFRALDQIDVPNVWARARMIGPKPPEPESTPSRRRTGALVMAAVIAIAAVLAITRAIGDPPPSPGDRRTPSSLRRDGEIVTAPRLTGAPPLVDLVAQDPVTGAVRTMVDGSTTSATLGSAAWSADGRWLAYEYLGCAPRVPEGGLWVTDSPDGGRQITTRRCFENSHGAHPHHELWAWSPAESFLVSERVREEGGDELVLLDPATGADRSLVRVAGGVTALAWSPDGSAIVYATGSGAIFSVDVAGDARREIRDVPGSVYGIGRSGLQWSPDGSHLAVEVSRRSGTRLYVLDADGSHLRLLATGIQGSAWSPDGSRIAFARFRGPALDPRIDVWTVWPDGRNATVVFEAPSLPNHDRAGYPVWSPEGQIAFAHAAPEGELVWRTTAGEIGLLQYLSWRGGWYFCECYA